MPRALKDPALGSSRSGSPSTWPTQKPKIPLIRWDGEFSFHTTKLLDWCQENESAHIKIFSDSTQEAKEAGQKKEVSSTSKTHYLQQAAHAVFVDDPNEQLQKLSQTSSKEFMSRITCRIKELSKQYNNANKSLGQTGAGRTYEELQNNPRTQNIVDGVIESFLWWPTLHGFWRSNPAFNTFFSTADPSQNFEAQTLVLFGQVDLSSGTNSPAETGGSDVQPPVISSNPPVPVPDSAIDPILLQLSAANPTSMTTMNVDDPEGLYRRLPSLPPPIVPPLTFNILPASRFQVQPSSQPLHSHVLLLHGHTGCSPTPFSFRGGAPCITPPALGERFYSLNSDDDNDDDIPNSRFKPTSTPGSHIFLSTQHREPAKPIASDSDSSPHITPSGLNSDSGSPSRHAVASVSTQLTLPGSGSSSNPLTTRRSSGKHRETPMDKFTSTFAQSNEMLVCSLEDSRRDKLEDKQRHWDAKFSEQENQRQFKKYMSDRKAEQEDKDCDAQLWLSADRLKQLELKVELAWLKHGSM